MFLCFSYSAVLVVDEPSSVTMSGCRANLPDVNLMNLWLLCCHHLASCAILWRTVSDMIDPFSPLLSVLLLLLLHWSSTLSVPPTQRSIVWWYVFSSVHHLWVCLFGCFSTRQLSNRLRYRHENFVGARYGQRLRQVRKWLHSDALVFQSIFWF